MKKLIAVVLLGLGTAQAGVAFAAENNTYTEAPWAPRAFMVSATTQFQGATQEIPGSDPFQSYVQ
jgi:hypothetical protein